MDHQRNHDLFLTDIVETETEYLPLLTPEEEKRMSEEDIPEEVPIMTLRNAVLFPGVVIPITVGRDKSIRLIKEAYKRQQAIGVVAQKDAAVEDPNQNDLHEIGTIAMVMKTLQMPDGNTTVIIQGKRRFKLQEGKKSMRSTPKSKGYTKRYTTLGIK